MFVNLLLAVDSDSDGVSDEIELSMGTNPNNGQEYDGLVNESGQFSYAFNLYDDWTKYLIDNHQAEVYSEGALTAAKWIINKRPGLYSMRDLLNFK